jgi:hypothetical protein
LRHRGTNAVDAGFGWTKLDWTCAEAGWHCADAKVMNRLWRAARKIRNI